MLVKSSFFPYCTRHATNVVVRIPVPKATVSSSHEPLGPGQMSELKISDKCFLWKCKKIHGGEELLLLLRVRYTHTHTHTHTQSVFTYSMRRNVISHNTGEGGGVGGWGGY